MTRFTLPLVAALTLACAARADLEFVGVMMTSQGNRFAVGDTDTGRTEWIAVGEKFAGHAIRGFDAKNETLVVERDGTERRLRLKDEAKVKASRLDLTGSITFGGTEKIDIERATLLYDQENVFSLQNGVTYRITPTRREDGNIEYAIIVERELGENKRERIAAPKIVALPGHPFRLQVGELGFGFKPR